MQALSATYALGSCAVLSASRPTSSAPRQLPARRQMRVVALAATPKGVTQPTKKPIQPPPAFGFVDNAERINSRAAMIGFIALMLIEAITNKNILEFAGVAVGKGMNVGF